MPEIAVLQVASRGLVQKWVDPRLPYYAQLCIWISVWYNNMNSASVDNLSLHNNSFTFKKVYFSFCVEYIEPPT